MSIAFVSSLRSKDPSTRHGACVVDCKKHIIGTGYNGFPNGCSDDIFPWARDGKFSETKMAYVVHAEVNAILNSVSNVCGCSLYLYSQKGYYPCCECAKVIVQSGISEVVVPFLNPNNTDIYNWEPTRKMFECAGIKIRELEFDKVVNGFNLMSSEILNDLDTAKNIVNNKCN